MRFRGVPYPLSHDVRVGSCSAFRKAVCLFWHANRKPYMCGSILRLSKTRAAGTAQQLSFMHVVLFEAHVAKGLFPPNKHLPKIATTLLLLCLWFTFIVIATIHFANICYRCYHVCYYTLAGAIADQIMSILLAVSCMYHTYSYATRNRNCLLIHDAKLSLFHYYLLAPALQDADLWCPSSCQPLRTMATIATMPMTLLMLFI